MKRQRIKLQFLLMTFILSCSSNVTAQSINAGSNNAFDSYVNNPVWSWTVDNDENSPDTGAGFKWWNNGGNRYSDMLMQMTIQPWGKSFEIPSHSSNCIVSLMANAPKTGAREVMVYPYIFLQTGNARSSIFYGKDSLLNFSINPKAPTNHSTFSYAEGFRFLNSNGADITNSPSSYGYELMRITKEGLIGMGTTHPDCRLHIKGTFKVESSDNQGKEDSFTINTNNTKAILTSTGDDEGMFLESKTGNKITIGDGDDTVFIQSRDIFLNYGHHTDTIQMSINSNRHVDNAVLTIAGATYIGPKAGLAAVGKLSKFNPGFLSQYCLWVEKGIVSEDYAFANVETWRDDVFKSDYDLLSLEEVKSYIDTNKHLPNVPSEKNIKENGYTAHQMNMLFLQKIEELTLHTIFLNERIKELETRQTYKENNR